MHTHNMYRHKSTYTNPRTRIRQQSNEYMTHISRVYIHTHKHTHAQKQEEDEDGEPLTRTQVLQRSAMLLTGGTLLVALFADPMVDAVTEFSHASNIPTFFVAFVVTPFASNASEVI